MIRLEREDHVLALRIDGPTDHRAMAAAIFDFSPIAGNTRLAVEIE